MGWREDAEQGFPPQRHQEPFALRQDILDELMDHLSMAAEREAESGVENDTEIKTRVLDKFGDPTAVARSLWWDAMKETVVKDWIQISINALLCIAVIGFMSLFYRQMQSSNVALLGALSDRSAPSENAQPSVEFVFHRGTLDGPLAEGIRVELKGRPFGDDETSIREISDGNGHVGIGPIRPGQYLAYLSDATTNLQGRKSVTLFAKGETTTVHVVAPPATKVSLDMSRAVSGQVHDEDFRLIATMESRWSHPGLDWSNSRSSFKVMITSEGLFEVIGRGLSNNVVRLGMPITHAFGTRISFHHAGLARPNPVENDGEKWFGWWNNSVGGRSFKASWDIGSYELDVSGSNSIELDLPKDMLDTYSFYIRNEANKEHGLPERFAWFEYYVTGKYKDYVIDEARLVGQKWTYFYYLPKEEYRISTEVKSTVIGKYSGDTDVGWAFPLNDMPKELPAGYRLLLAINGPRTGIQELDISLNAYLDTQSPKYELGMPKVGYENPPHTTQKPVWTKSAESIAEEWRGDAFLDLTDMVNGGEKIDTANGLVFMWDRRTLNWIREKTESSANIDNRPVWIVLKPHDTVSSAEGVAEN